MFIFTQPRARATQQSTEANCNYFPKLDALKYICTRVWFVCKRTHLGARCWHLPSQSSRSIYSRNALARVYFFCAVTKSEPGMVGNNNIGLPRWPWPSWGCDLLTLGHETDINYQLPYLIPDLGHNQHVVAQTHIQKVAFQDVQRNIASRCFSHRKRYLHHTWPHWGLIKKIW